MSIFTHLNLAGEQRFVRGVGASAVGGGDFRGLGEVPAIDAGEFETGRVLGGIKELSAPATGRNDRETNGVRVHIGTRGSAGAGLKWGQEVRISGHFSQLHHEYDTRTPACGNWSPCAIL